MKFTEAINSPVKETFKGMEDWQWMGNGPYCEGGGYYVDGGIAKSSKYVCWFGGGETVGGRVAKADIKFSNDDATFDFWLFGINDPHVRCTITPRGGGGKVVSFDSWEHSPILFDKYFARYLNEAPFKSKFGRMTISAMADALEYRAFWANAGLTQEGSR